MLVSGVVVVRSVKRNVGYTEGTWCAVAPVVIYWRYVMRSGAGYDRIMKYLQDGYCDMILVFDGRNRRAGTATPEGVPRHAGRHQLNTNVSVGDRTFNSCGTCERRWRADCPATSQLICLNCSCGSRAVENLYRYRARISTVPTNCLQSTS